MKVEPTPTSEWTWISELMEAQSSETRARPRPVPRWVGEDASWVKGSKMDVSASAAIPGPVSCTERQNPVTWWG